MTTENRLEHCMFRASELVQETSFGARVVRFAALTLASAFVFAGCSSSEPEVSTAEILSELEGRELTAAELAEREQVASTLCRLDDAVLIEIWDQLSAKQLEFQDFVFSRTCDNRNQLYAEATGRFAVSE